LQKERGETTETNTTVENPKEIKEKYHFKLKIK